MTSSPHSNYVVSFDAQKSSSSHLLAPPITKWLIIIITFFIVGLFELKCYSGLPTVDLGPILKERSAHHHNSVRGTDDDHAIIKIFSPPNKRHRACHFLLV